MIVTLKSAKIKGSRPLLKKECSRYPRNLVPFKNTIISEWKVVSQFESFLLPKNFYSLLRRVIQVYTHLFMFVNINLCFIKYLNLVYMYPLAANIKENVEKRQGETIDIQVKDTNQILENGSLFFHLGALQVLHKFKASFF